MTYQQCALGDAHLGPQRLDPSLGPLARREEQRHAARALVPRRDAHAHGHAVVGLVPRHEQLLDAAQAPRRVPAQAKHGDEKEVGKPMIDRRSFSTRDVVVYETRSGINTAAHQT